MGRLDIPDKYTDTIAVSKEYLAELYEEIATLKAELEVARSTRIAA